MKLPYDFGKYELRRKLGSGAFAQVFLAWHRALKTHHVLKILRPEIREDPLLLQRFHTEAQIMASMQHENIVRVTDMDEWNNELYIAMEHVEGVDLSQWLERDSQPPIEIVLLMLQDICRGLSAAHTRTIHRDIKPANMIFATDGVVKLMDFGLARRIEDLTVGMTQVGTVLGTPAYMSPEQDLGEPLDRRTDIFSVGVVAYRLLTGDRPFPGNTVSEIRQSLRTHEPQPLVELNQLVPAGVATIIHHMLEKDRERRCQGIEDAGDAISRALATLGITEGRELMRKYAANPSETAQRLEELRVERHLTEGVRLAGEGPAAIPHAIREFEYVLAMRRNHREAAEHIRSLERRRKELERERRTPATAPIAEPGETLLAPVLGDAPGTDAIRHGSGAARSARKPAIRRRTRLAAVAIPSLVIVAGAAFAWLRPWESSTSGGPSTAISKPSNATSTSLASPPPATPTPMKQAPAPPPAASPETPRQPSDPPRGTVNGSSQPASPSAAKTSDDPKPLPPAPATEAPPPSPAVDRPGDRVGTLVVDLRPDVAVFVDDERVSITGYKRMSLEPGPHTVRAAYRDYQFVRQVEIEPGRTTTVEYDLIMASSGSVRLVLASAEGWGHVVVDDVKRREQAPGLVEGLVPGRHTISVDGPQYRLDGDPVQVDVVAGRTIEVPIRLRRK